METPNQIYEKLDEANTLLVKELLLIKSTLDIYGLIGLNASRIEVGKKFFGHVQDQSLRILVLGFDKVFERENEEDGKIKSELCSISGVFREAKRVPIRQPDAWRRFVEKYGVRATADWIWDVESVLSSQRPKVKASMSVIASVRNTRIAHLSQSPTEDNLPSIAVFKDLLGLTFDFHAFVTEAFLNSHAHDVLDDTRVKGSLKQVLERIGIASVISEFAD